MPHQGPRRLPAGERDRRLAEEVLYLHSLWRRAAPAPAPIQPCSDRALSRKERKRRKIAAAAAEPVLASPPPTTSPGTLAEAAGASAPSTANPPPPTTAPGPLTAQREPVPSWLEFTNRDSADDWPGRDRDRKEQEEAARYFTGLFQRDARLRGHYTRRWRNGQFQCMVCAAAGAEVGTGKAPRQFRAQLRAAAREFRGCLPLVRHARNPPRSRGRHGRYGRRGAHRALAAVVCRLLGWDVEAVVRRRRIVMDPRATAGVQHAKENDGAGENEGFSTGGDRYSIDEDEDSEDEESVDEEENDGAGKNEGFSTGDDSYSIDEDEDSEDEESVDEEEDIETGITDPATDGDEEDSEIESDEEYAEKEDHENRMDSSTDGDEDANELEIIKETGQKEAVNSIARKRDTKMRDSLLNLTHAKPVDTIPKKTEVWKSSLVPKHKEVSIPGIKFNEGSDKAKRKASALSYQGLKSSTSGVVKKVKVNQQPNNKGKQSKTNETGASARKTKRPAVAARKAKLLAKKQLAQKQGGCLNS